MQTTSSFVSGIWLSFDITSSFLIALLCGTLSGWVLVLGGEALTPRLRSVEVSNTCMYGTYATLCMYMFM